MSFPKLHLICVYFRAIVGTCTISRSLSNWAPIVLIRMLACISVIFFNKKAEATLGLLILIHPTLLQKLISGKQVFFAKCGYLICQISYFTCPSIIITNCSFCWSIGWFLHCLFNFLFVSSISITLSSKSCILFSLLHCRFHLHLLCMPFIPSFVSNIPAAIGIWSVVSILAIRQFHCHQNSS